MGFKLKYRNVQKGYDHINEVDDPGVKRVEVRHGDKMIVKEKYIDDTGRRRKLKTKYKGYQNIYSDEPNVVVSQKFTAKGGGQGYQKEDYLADSENSPLYKIKGGGPPEPITRNRVQHLRNLPRNSSGRDETVRMATYSGGENNDRYFAAPTITFKGNEPARPQSFDEALNAGEVYEFKSKKRADKFAAGSWKKGKPRREAMKDYRQRKRNSSF